MVRRKLLTPLTTWHTQTGLLLISLTWGASYMMPHRIPFSEVFPDDLTQGWMPMWVWGVTMVICASIALVAEQVINRSDGPHDAAWRTAWSCHSILAAIYSTLSVAALFQGVGEVTAHGSGWWVMLSLSATTVSRPVLWGYIAYLHITFANLRRPK